jgi:hypothetical protein
MTTTTTNATHWLAFPLLFLPGVLDPRFSTIQVT